MKNIVKICVSEGCPIPGRASRSDQEIADFIGSNGDTVAYAERCPQVCRILGGRVIADVTSPSRLCIVAGDGYDVHPILIDGMGLSGVIGDNADGSITIGLLNGKQYPAQNNPSN